MHLRRHSARVRGACCYRWRPNKKVLKPVDVAKPIRCAGDVKLLTRAMARLVAAKLGSKKANVRLIRANENLPCEAGG